MIHNLNESMIEEIKRCPICGHDGGEVAFEEIYDWMYKSGEQEWQYNECIACHSLYLAVRPLPEYIYLAYQKYYTHSVPDKKNNAIGNVVQKLIRDYLRAAKKAHLNGKLKYCFYILCFPLKAFLDSKSRHIEKLHPGNMLDFGCGNGEFISLAREFGWKVKGFDMDPNAVSQAKSNNLDVVKGGIEKLSYETDSTYDLITLSHVIEHVYETDILINECMRLLKPGGLLWIETPNCRSIGLKLYGKYWRGLEPPRHLSLFNYDSLIQMLVNAGFHNIKTHHHVLSGLYMCLASERNRTLSKARTEHESEITLISTIRGMFLAALVEVIQAFNSRRAEFLTIVVEK